MHRVAGTTVMEYGQMGWDFIILLRSLLGRLGSDRDTNYDDIQYKKGAFIFSTIYLNRLCTLRHF